MSECSLPPFFKKLPPLQIVVHSCSNLPDRLFFKKVFFSPLPPFFNRLFLPLVAYDTTAFFVPSPPPTPLRPSRAKCYRAFPFNCMRRCSFPPVPICRFPSIERRIMCHSKQGILLFGLVLYCGSPPFPPPPDVSTPLL